MSLYLVKEDEYVPWQIALASLGYINELLEGHPDYILFKVNLFILHHCCFVCLNYFVVLPLFSESEMVQRGLFIFGGKVTTFDLYYDKKTKETSTFSTLFCTGWSNTL
jgi:hypothetical protein